MIAKIKSQFKKTSNSYWVKSGKYSLMTRLSGALFGLGSFWMLIRMVSNKEEFGVWVLFISITGMMESLRNAFVYNPLVRFLNIEEVSDKGKIMAGSFCQNLVFTLITTVLLLALASPLTDYWEAESLDVLLYIFVGTNLLYLLFSHFDYIQQANLYFKGAFYIAFLRKGLFFCYVTYLYFGSSPVDLVNLAWVQLIIMGLCLPFAFLFSKQFFELTFREVGLWFKNLVNFGKYTVGTNFSSMLFSNIDSWMLGSLLSTASVAIYNPVIKITNLVEIPVGSLTAISYPKITKSIKERGMGAAKDIYEKSVGLILAGMIPVVCFVILAADKVIILIAGEEYLDAIPILKVAVLYGLIIPFNRQFGITVNALGKANVNLAFVVVNAIVNIISNYIFINQFGIIGAAYGTLTAYVLSLVYSQVYLSRTIGVSFFGIIVSTWKYYRFPFRVLSQNK